MYHHPTVTVVCHKYYISVYQQVRREPSTKGKGVLILGESDHASNLQFSAVVCQDPR